MQLSIVTTLYHSSEYINEFYEKISKEAQKLTNEYEIIFVDDGSPDDSLEKAIILHKKDTRVKVIELSRNFGHHKAMMTGLTHAKGKQIFLIDSDLEEDPKWLSSFSQQMIKEKCDVVYGVQKVRKGGLFEQWSGILYYKILNWLLNIEHPRNITTARLMTKAYVDALLLYKEREMVISGLWILTGFKQHSQIVNKMSTSETTYSLGHRLSHFVNTITSFSSKPLISIFFTGITIFSISLCYALYLIANRLFLSIPLYGWTSIMVSVWLLGGITISFIGVIGIYLSKVFTETKQRPYIIIKDIYGEEKD